MKKNLPMIFQNDSLECGFAALAMILHFYGYVISLNELREQHPLSLTGLSIATLVKIARHYQLFCQVLRIEPDEVFKVKLPAILHWNLNHFVVLKKINKQTIILHDPSKGELSVSKEQFAEKFSGIVLECTPTKTFQLKAKTKEISWLRLLTALPNIKSLLVKIGIFTLSYQLFLLLMPRYLRTVIDQIVPASHSDLLMLVIAGFVGLRLLATLAKAFKLFCIHALDRHLSVYLSETVCEHIMRLPLSYFENHYLGDILNRFNSIEQLRVMISSGLMEGLLGGFLAITTALLMLRVSCALALATFSISFAYLLLRFKLMRRYQSSTAEMLSAKSAEQICFLENIRGIQPIKIFLKERERLALWMSRYHYFMQVAHENNLLKAFSDYSKELFVGLEIIVVIFLAATKLMSHELSTGLFYSYLFYRQQFSESLMLFAEKLNDLKIVPLYRERLTDFLRMKKEPPKLETTLLPEKVSLTIKNLSFRYSEHTPAIFSDLNFSIKASEIVALVGPSGMGKTTLLKVMMGLLKPSSGTILVNDMRLDQWHPLQSFMASVMQDDCLLSGTIAENIAFFSKEADFMRIVDCARKAGVLEEIFRMPMKLNTLVGDMGMILSGGQKQRVLLARAFYANPKILFLDEATSHLDVAKEREINNLIKSLGITTIMVAHRPETIQMGRSVIALTP